LDFAYCCFVLVVVLLFLLLLFLSFLPSIITEVQVGCAIAACLCVGKAVAVHPKDGGFLNKKNKQTNIRTTGNGGETQPVNSLLVSDSSR
jgi:hypothetical protein